MLLTGTELFVQYEYSSNFVGTCLKFKNLKGSKTLSRFVGDSKEMEEEIKHEINGFLSNSNFCTCGKFPCVYKYEGCRDDCSLSVTNKHQVNVISHDQCCRCLTTSDAKVSLLLLRGTLNFLHADYIQILRYSFVH